MPLIFRWPGVVVTSLSLAVDEPLRSEDMVDLAEGFASPPPGARLRAFRWWLNSHVAPDAITRDLEEMKTKAVGGALISHAGGAGQAQSRPVRAQRFLTVISLWWPAAN